jgi:hypothetical protein
VAEGGAFSIIDHGSEPCKPGRPGRKLRALAVALRSLHVGPRGKPCLPKWIADTANLLVKAIIFSLFQ